MKPLRCWIYSWLLLSLLVGNSCARSPKKLLDVPHTRQSYGYSCGPSAVQVVMAYYGEDFHESELISLLKTDTSEGTYVRDIRKFFHYHGLTARVAQRMTVAELEHYIDRGIPVIVLIQAWGDEKEFRSEYKDAWEDGHFVVVIGYTDKDILFSDPSLYNPGYIPKAEFQNRWHDLDEGTHRTFQLGIAVYGREPAYRHDEIVRIE